MPDNTTASNYFRDVVFVADPNAPPLPDPDPEPEPDPNPGATTLPESYETVLTDQTPTETKFGNMHNMLGVAFSTKVDGTITHIRFYASAEESGTHLIGLWDGETGELLLEDYLEWDITAGTTGWQYYELPTPVSITAGKTYVVGVSCGTCGTYSWGSGQLATAFESGNLITYDNSGRWRDIQTQAIAMPDNTTASNYFRDVVFVPAS